MPYESINSHFAPAPRTESHEWGSLAFRFSVAGAVFRAAPHRDLGRVRVRAGPHRDLGRVRVT